MEAIQEHLENQAISRAEYKAWTEMFNEIQKKLKLSKGELNKHQYRSIFNKIQLWGIAHRRLMNDTTEKGYLTEVQAQEPLFKE